MAHQPGTRGHGDPGQGLRVVGQRVGSEADLCSQTGRAQDQTNYGLGGAGVHWSCASGA